MTEYRVGQRVRIQWPDGGVVEGALTACDAHKCGQCGQLILRIPNAGQTPHMFWAWADPAMPPADGRIVTVLSEPRPDEPTGLGAVVNANIWNPDTSTLSRWTLVRATMLALGAARAATT